MKIKIIAVIMAIMCILALGSITYADDNIPYVFEIQTDGFNVDCKDFDIRLYVNWIKDTRGQLEVCVEDADGNVVAVQQNCTYYINEYLRAGLKYHMNVVGELVADSPYYVKLNHSGADFDYDPDETQIYPNSGVDITGLELVDRDMQMYKLYLENVEVGEVYEVYVERNPSDVKMVEVLESNVCYVEFGSDYIIDTSDNLVVRGTNIDDENNYDYIWISEALEPMPEIQYGIYCDEYIFVDADSVWFQLGNKTSYFSGSPYAEEDLEKLDAYMFDLTTEEVVGNLDYKEYIYEFGKGVLDGSVALNKSLDENHEYMLVVNDGYTVRTCDYFEIIAEPVIMGVYVSSVNKEHYYYSELTEGTTEFYASVHCYGINDMEGIKLEFIDSNGDVIGIGAYNPEYGNYKFVLDNPIGGDVYTIRATYGDLSLDNIIYVYQDGGYFGRIRPDSVAGKYDGNYYIVLREEGNVLNPEEYTYQLEMYDGTVIDAYYHRQLDVGDDYDGDIYNDYKYHVLKVDDTLVNFGDYWSVHGYLKAYMDGIRVNDDFENTVNFGIDMESQPFMYTVGGYGIFGEEIKFYGEGLSSSKIYDIITIDDSTEETATVRALYSDEGSVTFNKDSFKDITIKSSLMYRSDLYVDNNEKGFYLEHDGEYLDSVDSVVSLYANNVVDQRLFFDTQNTNKSYVGLTLPADKYDYYRLADSIENLMEEDFVPIETGLLYRLKDTEGKQIIFAQFKTELGELSAPEIATITTDTVAPDFVITSQIPETFTANENNGIFLNFYFNTNEVGYINIDLFDKNGRSLCLYSYYFEPTQTSLTTVLHNSLKAKKMVIYMNDSMGNKSVKYSYDINVVKNIDADINGDTYTNIQDVIAILRHINNTEVLENTDLLDVNNDGLVNVQDVICLLNYVNNSEQLY